MYIKVIHAEIAVGSSYSERGRDVRTSPLNL